MIELTLDENSLVSLANTSVERNKLSLGKNYNLSLRGCDFRADQKKLLVLDPGITVSCRNE